jgi:hypothetical protein
VDTNLSTALLPIVTAAVTPVVMISAAAVLILGIQQKHAGLADRLRLLTLEFRAPESTTERKENIRAQVKLFARRISYAARAHVCLYASALCFVGMVLVIALTFRSWVWDQIGIALFVVGTLLILGAVFLELLELRMASRTIQLEIRDVLMQPTQASVEESPSNIHA